MDGLEDRVVLSAAAAPSAIVWTGGAGDGLWHTPENWDGNVVPTPSDDVEIGTATVTVAADQNALAKNLTTTADTTLNFASGASLSGDPGGTFANHGKITKLADAAAKTSSIGIEVNNQGTILVGVGGTLNLAGGLANYANVGSTLSGGTYEVSGTLGVPGSIQSLAEGANVALSGEHAGINVDPGGANALIGLRTINAGTSLAIKDLTFTMNKELANAGNLKIQAGKLTLRETFTNTGTITIGITGEAPGRGGYGVLETSTDGATLGGALIAEFVNYTPSSFPASYNVINTGSGTSPDIRGEIGFTQPNSLPPGVVMTRSTTPSGSQHYRSVNLTIEKLVLQSITVTPNAPGIAKGETAQFTAMGSYSGLSEPVDLTGYATWSATNLDPNPGPTVASIDALTGEAKGLNVGQATIIASYDGVNGSTTLNVDQARLLSLIVSPTSATIAKGQTATFTANAKFTDTGDDYVDVTGDASWISSNDLIADIIAAGQAKGLGVSVDGPVTITAVYDGKTATAMLTVDEAKLLSFTISPTSDLLYLGQTRQFTAMGHFTDGENREVTDLVIWESSVTTVAKIDALGLATALTPGNTTISATYGDLGPVTAALEVAIQARVAATSVSWGSLTAPLATAADGVRLLPSGRSYGDTIGWAGINRINITLDHDAVLTAADITVTSLANINYGTVTVTGSGKNWVITLANKIDVADRVTFSINNNPGIQPFERRLDVLPGDVNGDGVVSLQDVIYIRNGMQNFDPILLPIYFLDVVGDGGTKPTQNSLTAALRRFGTQLPSLT